jgi:hypothetical protein
MYIVLRGKIPVAVCRTLPRARELCVQLNAKLDLEYYILEVVEVRPVKRA